MEISSATKILKGLFCGPSIDKQIKRYTPLRWLDTVFQGQYLPRLSVNYVAINKDLEKLTPQLY